VFVGAAPLPNLKDLGSEYKLLPIPSSVSDKLKMVYTPSSVTYTKMDPSGVPTVSVRCLFIARNYKSKRMITTLDTFRKSFFTHLDDIKETPGNHKKWQDVSDKERGTWTWLDLPSDVNVK
jgi:hypothetical protein